MFEADLTNDVTGDFEVHITACERDAGQLADFAEERGLKYTHVLLDRGQTASQPMLTLKGSGSLDQQRDAAEQWTRQLRAAGLGVVRVKIEAAPWCAGVPVTDEEANVQPAGRYFEHHVKLLLPAGVPTLVAATEVVERHGARLSRNARRARDGGREERFVTQRSHRVGRDSAKARLDDLVAALRDSGWEILAIEQEYVVFDDRIELDAGWLAQSGPSAWHLTREEKMRSAPAGTPGYPNTYQPLPAQPGVRQRAAFDPALKQYGNAYRAGEPVFSDPGAGQRWRAARCAAMRHLVTVIADTPWADHLVLRGSVTMSAWFGAAAREPGDVDFVVTPFSMGIHSDEAKSMLAGILSALRHRPGAGLDPDRVETTDIWTYERADGRRLVLPFTTDGGLIGSVQADFVFNEHLPLAPITIRLDGVDRPVQAASAELSLAWKLLWLATDMYPQGKDLYDAVLLAERTTVSLRLVRDLLRPELGAEADDFTAESVLAWNVDWDNFTDEYPGIPGDVETWKRRLALALDRGFTAG
ncbi:nucleotidyl transferase AbiEii/AbiGii toxin family protein [Micromonospora purpureochromogenes]|uniref:nucleotidyl transferase AbiEii/AbiGii toxin family protein n=1 Tax=Micromonospora purpureochromogenes TaxID=47872 RepID=UPI001E4CA5EA|nr:nucleotidyl transferase AbiEii/AbiGii toxin family protein [Micromonospora purpureochromogenes]